MRVFYGNNNDQTLSSIQLNSSTNFGKETPNKRLVKKIKTLASRTYAKPIKHLESTTVLEYLNAFKQKYVMVPADKASNNIIIVCKLYYIKTII